MKQLDVGELNQMYSEDEQSDKTVFAEMRSNILLVSGQHYAKRSADKYFGNLRDSRRINDEQKLRLTKNHMQKIAHAYEEAIMSQSPGVKVLPQVDSEMQDRKDAELNQAVWEFTKTKHKVRSHIREWVKDYVEIGEVAVKITWDPNKGELLGYGEDERPVYSGDLEIERIFAFNLLRAAGCKSMDENPRVTIRKLVDLADLKAMYAGQEDKLKLLEEASKEEFVVFDSAQGGSYKTGLKKQCLIKETYIKPCYDCPEGYFYIFTEKGILEEGPLPFGIFPIIWHGFDTYPTLPRGYSVIKRVRPYQVELNRAASQQATHQVTLADDKILYQAGTKLQPGALLPGVRGVTYQGQPPTILSGRTGEQFTAYIEATIMEMYQVAELDELMEDNPNSSQVDPWANLYKSIRQKKKFSKYGEGFEQFLIDVCFLTLETLKQYLPDDAVVQMVGRKEIVNIPEFKKTTPLAYQIKVEAMDDTLESQMGKQLTINQIMQYVGKQLPSEAIGKLMRNMPFGNFEESFSEFTIDYDNFENACLSLERAEPPNPSPSDNHEYMIKMFNSRMKRADFKYLDPQIQSNYETVLQFHEDKQEEQLEQIKAAEAEMIPTDGPMVPVGLYVEDKQDPSKAPKLARVPTRAVEWLVKQMELQGATLDKLEKFDQQNLANISSRLLSSGQAQVAQAQPGGMNGSTAGSGQPGNN